MMIDRLEPRQLFATLTGYAFADADGSRTFDANEKGTAGTTVFIDSNLNGMFDDGERSATTNARGKYTFTGLSAGEYTVGTTTDSTAFTSTTATPDGTKQGRFNITVTGLEDAPILARKAITEAVEKWETVITGDLPDVTLDDGTVVDDLLIRAKIGPIDGTGSSADGDILAYAGPDAARAGDGLPYLASLRVDSADLTSLESSGQLDEVITHEIGHALGFGTVWRTKHLIVGATSKDPRFVGQNAVREYNLIYRTNNLSVPIANTGSDGTRNSHWRESALNEELMTGFIPDVGQPAPLSGITVGQFQDIGYDVDYDAADQWNPRTHAVTKTVATDLGGVANERTLTLDDSDTVGDFDFGFRAVTAPVIRSFSINPSPVASGTNVVLSATAITDADGDTLQGVSFWRESNGIPGLQKESDTQIAVRTFAKRRVYSVLTSTTGLVGDQTYYAVAVDSGGRAGRRTGVVNVASTTVPVSTPSGLAVRQRASSVVRFAFVDDDADVNGYRIQLATSRNFGAASLVSAFNITSDETATTIGDLTPGLTYYIRVRAYNLAGVTPYSTPLSFETT